jgi:DNA invertase Pin-like site-specific DNA recombinase
MFGMLSVFSEFERAIIQERIAAGMARAKAKGSAAPGSRRQSASGSARRITLAEPACAIWLRSFVLGARLYAVSCVAATETP